MSERPITRLAPLVDMLMAAIRPVLQHPFALFGHSMGAVVAFEFARRLHALGEPAPVRLFVSGARAPHLPHPAASQAPPSDASVLAMVRTLGGVPEDLFRNPSLLDQLLPVWRADIGLHRSYEFRNGSVLDCPITAFAGTSDAEVSPPSVREWVAHTRGPFRLRIFDGDHFFIRPHQADVLREVRSDLERWLT